MNSIIIIAFSKIKALSVWLYNSCNIQSIQTLPRVTSSFGKIEDSFLGYVSGLQRQIVMPIY